MRDNQNDQKNYSKLVHHQIFQILVGNISFGKLICNLMIFSFTIGEHEIGIVVNGQQLGIGPFVMEVSGLPKIARIPSTVLAGKELIFECKLP